MRYFLVLAWCLLSGCQSFVSGKIKPILSDNLQTVVQNHEATVLIWWSPQCPCVKRFESRIYDLKNAYANRSVAVWLVSSNSDDSMEQPGLRLPIFLDKNAVLANEIGVDTTPTAVLLDKTGTVKFAGWIDNERLPGLKGRIPYLQNALDQLLAGKEIERPRAPVYGCRITR